MVILNKVIVFNQDKIYAEDVIIMPGALISTNGQAKVIFQGRVSVVGSTQVFAKDANLVFHAGTIGEFNVAWFGAKGYDNTDDTEVFRKVIQVARNCYNSVTIFIPVGRYFISETLNVECDPNQKKSINWKGESMSNSGTQGSSISWNGPPGGTLMKFSHVNQFFIENIDFKAEPNHPLKNNLLFRPFVHQVFIRHCSFSGAQGQGSTNINLNEENGDQVSEIHVDNCSFNGEDIGGNLLTSSAISGGLANTKNFYIQHSAFSSYHTAAINIRISDVLRVEGCTFSYCEIDIYCGLGGTYAVSNYSEQSKAFFCGGVSSNIAVTTLMNNVFAGVPRDGYVIRDGSGRLVLLNNIFGGTGQEPDNNRVRWQTGEFNSIYSAGNFFKNASVANFPFYNRSNQVDHSHVITVHDGGGVSGPGRKPISN